jgi:hypothetical protein
MDWFYLAQDRGKWRALVTTIMNPRVDKIQGISLLAEDLLAFQEAAKWSALVR